jgi:tripartite-type tricarboxylate transporter receptor subunit TctC
MRKIIFMIVVIMITMGLCSCGKSSNKAALDNESKESTADLTVADFKWPAKNVQVSIPYKAGGGVDKAARLVCAELEKSTGKTFVITNKPEGNGIIAINELAGQEPDGYNLMVVSNRDLFGHIVNDIEGVEYDKDTFTYIATLLEGADCLFSQSGKYSSFEQMIQYAKANPGKLTIATSNNTGLQTINDISDKLDIELTSVAYSSGADAFADLLGGHVDGAMVALSFYVQGKENGVIPVLTMTSEKFPVDNLEVDCLSDYGLEEAASPMFRFLLGPAGMDQVLIDKMVEQLDMVYTPESVLCKNITAQYDNPKYITGNELSAFVEENYQLRLKQASND